MSKNYQTIQHADGTIEEGLFPTLDWFDKIKKHIKFKGNSVLDVGCCTGMLSILSLLEGASEVAGIEKEIENCNVAVGLAEEYKVDLALVNERVEDISLDEHFDIVLFPMIIHWIGEGETKRLITWANKYVVFIYREKNEGYNHPDNGIWFPSQKELDSLKTLKLVHSETLMEQDNGKKINLAIYEKFIS